MTDVKTGEGTIINPGGDDQRFGGLCMDSRGPGTLYATGRDSGNVYAFNRRGELLRVYPITASKRQNGSAFLTSCVQTRYQLLIIDSANPVFYNIPLSDEGPLRGHPPPLNPSFTYQAQRFEYAGSWVQHPSVFNAFGVEWTSKFNETAYVMNSASGQLFTMTIKKRNIFPVMRKVSIIGNTKLFPGALSIKFDSSNENILYITMPHLNAIAVLEISRFSPNKAKYILMLKHQLMDGPIVIGEYGDWIYPINGNFRRLSSDQYYTIPQVPRYRQIFQGITPDDEFTTSYDGLEEAPFPVITSVGKIEDIIRRSPKRKGMKAPLPISPPTPSENSQNVPGSAIGPRFTPPVTLLEGEEDEFPTDEPTSLESDLSFPPSPPSSEVQPTKAPNTVFGSATGLPEENTRDGSSCFPASATVVIENGNTLRMEELRIGHRVQVSTSEDKNERFSDLFLFSHQDAYTMSVFISIETSHGNRIELSPGHFLYINEVLTAAKRVQVGDVLQMQNGRTIRAKAISRVWRRGLYNPQTVAGDIVVSGVRVSTYTTAVQPVIATALMAPVRAVYWCGGFLPRLLSDLLVMGCGGMCDWLPNGMPVHYL